MLYRASRPACVAIVCALATATFATFYASRGLPQSQAPGWTTAQATAPRDGSRGLCDPAMLVFDVTGSMKGTRIRQAREATDLVLPALTRAREVGLVTYGGRDGSNRCATVDVHFAPQPDASARIQSVLDSLTPSGSTPLTAAVDKAAMTLKRHARSGAIVLVTDGEENCGGDPCALGRALKRSAPGIVVHVIGFRLRVDDDSGLVCLANGTGGRFAEVTDSAGLGDALTSSLGCPLLSGRQHEKRPWHQAVVVSVWPRAHGKVSLPNTHR